MTIWRNKNDTSYMVRAIYFRLMSNFAYGYKYNMYIIIILKTVSNLRYIAILKTVSNLRYIVILKSI